MAKKKSNFKETINNLKMSWKFIKKEKKSVVIVSILSLFLSVISVIVPIFSAQLIIKLTSNLLDQLVRVSLYIFIIEITRNIVVFIMSRVTNRYMLRVVTDVQMEMFKETLKISASDIDKNSTGLFIDRVNDDAGGIINIFTDLIESLLDFISNIGILIACLIINPFIFLYFILSSTIISYISSRRRKKYFELDKKRRKLKEKRTSLISEVVRGIRDVKLLNGEEGMLRKTKEQLEEVNKERTKMDNTRNIYFLIHGSVRDFFDVIFVVLCVLLISNNSLSVASAIVLNTYRNRVEGLLRIYNDMADIFKEFNLSASRVFEVLGNSFEKDKSGKILIDNISSISFSNVSFSYTTNEVLKNISFDINKGERIGFVGESGSGKSTIFNLLSKLYLNQKGSILINGIDIKELDNNSLRSNLSLIPQNPYIFNFSIKDNLKIGNVNVSDKEIVDACKEASIYDRIMSLDKGFDTVVGEGGVTLSGGEKQRLAIARSLVKNTDVILFDEATSSLDNITQNDVQQAIFGIDRSKTILIIAHRLSTVVHCDRIYVMDKGEIVGVGTHQELLKTCPKYQELFRYEEVENY